MLSRLISAALGLMLTTSLAAAEGKLVIYTSQPQQDAQSTVDAFKAAHPGVEVEWVRDGTPRIIAKLRAEIAAGAPQPDVLLIADTVTMEGLKREGLLMAHKEADVSAYDPAIHDKDRTYFSTKLITTGIAYNTKGTLKPASWMDLLKPEYKGQIAMPSPLTSGAALIHIASILQTPGLGEDYLKRLAANDLKPQGGNGAVMTAVAGGQKPVGIIVEFLPIREKAKGAPVEFVFPSDGVSYVTEPVAILASAKNVKNAKAFVDFLVSKPGQELAVRQGYMPAHPAVTGPAGFPKLYDIKLMTFDAGKVVGQDEALKKLYTGIFGE
jgi:iron(III) transport system substrate-binding protein